MICATDSCTSGSKNILLAAMNSPVKLGFLLRHFKLALNFVSWNDLISRINFLEFLINLLLKMSTTQCSWQWDRNTCSLSSVISISTFKAIVCAQFAKLPTSVISENSPQATPASEMVAVTSARHLPYMGKIEGQLLCIPP